MTLKVLPTAAGPLIEKVASPLSDITFKESLEEGRETLPASSVAVAVKE